MNFAIETTSGNNRPIILIVDDIPGNLQVLGTILSEYNYELIMAMSGEQALSSIERIKPDLILLDIMMPGMDGFEVCRCLKSKETTNNIPVIFLSAKNEPEDIVSGFEAGGVDYLTKPFIKSELLMRINTHLSLVEMQKQLRNEVASKNIFFSIISHDLRGSFGAILGFAKLIKEYRNNISERDYDELINDLDKGTQATFELLEDLLVWAKSQTNSLVFENRPLGLADEVAYIIKFYLDGAQLKGIQLISEVEDGITIFADKNALQTVLRNLVSNALKFTPKNRKIMITAKNENEFVRIYVIDEGIGIEKERIENLFRIDKKTTTTGTDGERGSGLGLSLVKDFVEKMGGIIGIESLAGKGTKVWFTLPSANKPN